MAKCIDKTSAESIRINYYHKYDDISENINQRNIKQKRKKLTNDTICNKLVDDTTNIAVPIQYKIIQNDYKRQKVALSNKKLNVDKSFINNALDESVNISKKKLPKSTNIGKMTTAGNVKLRKKFENIHAMTEQKLTAHAEQLRIEISDLQAALVTEQNAVRILR